MCEHHNPLHCIIPPNVFDHMASSQDAKIREIGLRNLEMAAEVRSVRSVLPLNIASAAIPRGGGKKREVYDMKNNPPYYLPGSLARKEGDPATKDAAVNEAYDNSGHTYDFYDQVFGRDSLDDMGMTLISSVHVGLNYNNAFWNSSQMAYGDGDGVIFERFTKSLDVVGHEFSHGVISYTCNLNYRDEPGAANEHFADVFGSLIKQWVNNQDVNQANWLIGEDIIVKIPGRRALRDMANPGTAYNDPQMGKDRQVAHLNNKYVGPADNGGVHWNSGILNKAFHDTAMAIGGFAWQVTGRIWYDAMIQLTPTSQFKDVAKTLRDVTRLNHGVAEQNAVNNALIGVGL